MTATLRFVLDQVASPADADLAVAARELARGLVATAPSGCDVEAIVPAGVAPEGVPGLAGTTTLARGRRELAAAWQLGVAPGVGGGMIHAPSLLAPLVRHDRVHDHDQTVVTVWDLSAWEHPEESARAAVAWQRGMLKRAVRFADAVVVPTHAAAERLAEIARLGDRIRVIAGAPPVDFRIPGDDVGRRRAMDLPEGFVLTSGSANASAGLAAAFAAVVQARADLPVVVIDAPDGEEPAIAEIAVAAGLPEGRLHVRGVLDAHDRAAVFAAALVYVAPSTATVFPWRLVEALRLGVPVVAAASAVHREVVAEGGLIGEGEGLAEQVAAALGSTGAAERLAVLAADRGRAFSWAGAAERVWQLHADL